MTLLTEIRTDAEYEFLKLWHSCKWMTWDRYPESIFMVSEGEVLFEQDWKNNYLFCKYSKVWSLFESKFEYNNMQINDMISGILEEHLKNGILIPQLLDLMLGLTLEELLKNGVLTPLFGNIFSDYEMDELLKNEVLTPCSNIGIGSMGVEEHLKKGSLTPYHFPFHAINELQEKMSKETLNPEIAPIRITNLWNKVIDQVIQKLT
jgi:hypothetical protein